LTLQHALQIALQHHRAGRLPEAEAIYRQILAAHPDHPDAIGLLASLAAHARRHELAAQLFSRAVAVNPAVAEYHLHLGLALHESRKFAEAAEAYAKGIALKPDCAEAYNNLGLTLREQGKRDEAVGAYQRAIELRPDNAEAYNNLGIVLADRGKLSEAVASYEHAIQLDSGFAEAHGNLGTALKEQGRLDEAAAAYARAIHVGTNDAEAHNNLAIVLSDQGKLDEAIAEFAAALRINPRYAAAHYNLANTLRAAGKLDQAIDSYAAAIHFQPNYPSAYNNLGGALTEQVKLDAAAGAFNRAIELKGDFAEGHYNLGIVLREQRKFAPAIAAFSRAIELRPDYIAAHQGLGGTLSLQGKLDEAVAAYLSVAAREPNNVQVQQALANALKDQGRIEEAMSAYERTLELKPDVVFHSNLVYGAHFHPGYDAAMILAEARRWNKIYAEPLAARIGPHSNTPNPDRRLRIGYLSPDLGLHPVGRFLLPLLESHDHDRHEVFCYSAVRIPDAFTSRLRSHADTWRSIVGMSNEKVARLIRQDGIDILVELSLHTARHRLLVMAEKPAPVQVSWLGYCSTTGLDTIDYRLSDNYFDPLAEDHYSEKTIRLPRTYWCYEPGVETPEIGPLPALDMSNGQITFACLNNFAKVSAPVLETWCRLLRAVPNSRLLLSAKEGSHRRAVSEIMLRGNVDPARVRFTGRIAMPDYFRLYNTVDIALDPFPFAGGTTTCDALWMGVPVITLAGRTAVGRAGVSVLTNVGLPELIADSQESYIRLAVELAGDLRRLSALRATLRDTMRKSPLTDAAGFARDVEAAYRWMWKQWCTPLPQGPHPPLQCPP
jgi:predicted O-linked N-acetylglucosamine transferase (SPINDLY family)